MIDSESQLKICFRQTKEKKDRTCFQLMRTNIVFVWDHMPVPVTSCLNLEARCRNDIHEVPVNCSPCHSNHLVVGN